MSKFNVGDEVQFVRQRGHWRGGYGGDWWEHYGHDAPDGRVISISEGIVVIWPDDGKKPIFAKPEDVFSASDYEGAKARIEQLNLECFGHKDGLWAAERARE